MPTGDFPRDNPMSIREQITQVFTGGTNKRISELELALSEARAEMRRVVELVHERTQTRAEVATLPSASSRFDEFRNQVQQAIPNSTYSASQGQAEAVGVQQIPIQQGAQADQGIYTPLAFGDSFITNIAPLPQYTTTTYSGVAGNAYQWYVPMTTGYAGVAGGTGSYGTTGFISIAGGTSTQEPPKKTAEQAKQERIQARIDKLNEQRKSNGEIDLKPDRILDLED